jgi:hypothetical protein
MQRRIDVEGIECVQDLVIILRVVDRELFFSSSIWSTYSSINPSLKSPESDTKAMINSEVLSLRLGIGISPAPPFTPDSDAEPLAASYTEHHQSGAERTTG